MNLYYFHIRNGHTILDDVGSRLLDIAAVKVEAVKVISETIRNAHPSVWDGVPWRLWVTDEPQGLGTTLLTLEVSGTHVAG